MRRRVELPRPTFRQRAAILLATQALTLLGLAAWTIGVPWPAGATREQVATPPPALVVTVGNGYVVRQHDWQPPR